MINSITQLASLYQKDYIAESYVGERFSKPLGRVQHQCQVECLNGLIKQYEARYILEIACGPARLTADVKGFRRGIAIDSSEQMLEIAQQRVKNSEKWQFINGDAFSINLSDRFQLIYTFRFIRHFRLQERMELYRRFHRLLDEKAIFVFDAVHYEKTAFFRRLENRGQERIYDKVYASSRELEDEVSRAGYEILELKGVIHHFYIQAGISRISNKLRKDNIAVKVIRSLERIRLGRPLEWIVICRRR